MRSVEGLTSLYSDKSALSLVKKKKNSEAFRGVLFEDARKNLKSNLVLVVVLVLAPVVQTLDSAIHRINHYPADKYLESQLRYRVDRDLSCG